MKYGDSARSSYLRFPMVVSQSWIEVSTPEGVSLGRVRTVQAARNLVRNARKEARA